MSEKLTADEIRLRIWSIQCSGDFLTKQDYAEIRAWEEELRKVEKAEKHSRSYGANV